MTDLRFKTILLLFYFSYGYFILFSYFRLVFKRNCYVNPASHNEDVPWRLVQFCHFLSRSYLDRLHIRTFYPHHCSLSSIVLPLLQCIQSSSSTIYLLKYRRVLVLFLLSIYSSTRTNMAAETGYQMSTSSVEHLLIVIIFGIFHIVTRDVHVPYNYDHRCVVYTAPHAAPLSLSSRPVGRLLLNSRHRVL